MHSRAADLNEAPKDCRFQHIEHILLWFGLQENFHNQIETTYFSYGYVYIYESLFEKLTTKQLRELMIRELIKTKSLLDHAASILTS